MMIKEYEIIIKCDDEKQVYIAEVPDVPDCVAEGKSKDEALKSLENLLKMQKKDNISESNRSHSFKTHYGITP